MSKISWFDDELLVGLISASPLTSFGGVAASESFSQQSRELCGMGSTPAVQSTATREKGTGNGCQTPQGLSLLSIRGRFGRAL